MARHWAAAARPEWKRVVDTNGEKRHVRRGGGLRGVRVVFEQNAVDCVVLDVSPTGARIRIPRDLILPEQVTLRFQRGEVVLARRRWQRARQVGLAFEKTESLVEEPRELAGRLLALVRAASIREPV